MTHTILHGDCLDLLRKMEANSVDLVFTSPPYEDARRYGKLNYRLTGSDWLRSDYEWIICASDTGRLPWSDNTAMGKPPKFPPGGDLTNRKQDGSRVRIITTKVAPDREGSTDRFEKLEGVTIYHPPKLANPGNVIRCSGGHLGSKLSHKSAAPFPEALAEFFIRSFCPPGGIVLDPFCGSGTTPAVAVRTDRDYIAMDLDPNMVELTKERINER